MEDILNHGVGTDSINSSPKGSERSRGICCPLEPSGGDSGFFANFEALFWMGVIGVVGGLAWSFFTEVLGDRSWQGEQDKEYREFAQKLPRDGAGYMREREESSRKRMVHSTEEAGGDWCPAKLKSGWIPATRWYESDE